MENLTLDYLPNHEDIKIYQHKKMFKINTDTAVLGEFLNIYKEDNVLDIGTNNGALLLYANIHTPNSLTGIDINNDALSIAKANLELNNITNFKLLNEDAKTFVGETKYDVIISNPPYFNTANESLKNNNEYLKMARHEEFLNLEELIKCVKRNLKENGHFYLVHKANRFNEISTTLNNYNLYISKLKFVYDDNKEFATTILIEAVNNKSTETKVLKPHIIKR